MIDQDRFELHLRTAIRSYAGAISSDLDAGRLARTIASAEPRRRVRIPGLPWTYRPMPRLAWVALMVTLLAVAAMLMLTVGRPPVELPAVVPQIPAVYACPAGSKPDEPGAFEQARPQFTDIRVAMDRQSGRVVAVVPRDDAGGWDTWTYDVCANRWAHAGAKGTLNPTDRLPELVYDWRLDLTIAVSRGGSSAWYDVVANRWETTGTASMTWARGVDRLAYDSRTGLVLAEAPTIRDDLTNISQLWSYDPQTSAWADVAQSGSGPSIEAGDHTLIAYDTTAGRLVAVNADLMRTWVLDLRTGAWVNVPVRTPRLNTGWFASGGEIAYDEANDRVVVFSDGQGVAFDTNRSQWEVVFESPVDIDWGTVGVHARMGHRMTYDPTNHRLLFIGGHYRTADGWVRADDVWAFDTTTREWIQLLEPSHIELAVDDGWLALPIPSSR